MGQPSYLCSVLFARAPVLGLCFFVSVTNKRGGVRACLPRLSCSRLLQTGGGARSHDRARALGPSPAGRSLFSRANRYLGHPRVQAATAPTAGGGTCIYIHIYV